MVVPPNEMETITVDDGSKLLSKKEIILLCISYFGLSVAFLMLSVECKYKLHELEIHKYII